MKNTIFKSAAALAIGMISISCVHEEMSEKIAVSDNQIEFYVSEGSSWTGASTKAGETKPVMLVSDTDDTLYLYISAEPTAAPAFGCGEITTKGTPITTESIKTIYTKFNVTAFPTDTYDEAYLSDVEPTYNSGTQSWVTDPVSLWPEDTNLDFYAYAPVDITGLSDLEYISGQKMSFTYQLPDGGDTSESNYVDAENQKDLLFAITTDYGFDTDYRHATFTFKHALSAVRFVAGEVKGAGTIQSISLKNLSSKGDAVFDGEDFEWNNLDDQDNTYTQTFNVDLAQQTAAQSITAVDSSKTFMMIPQTIDGSTTILEITYLREIDTDPVTFSVALPEIEWEAGITYTYKIGIDASKLTVNVDDTVTGNVKSDLVITNTGNMSGYIRAMIIANWVKTVDEEEVIVAPCNLSAPGFSGLMGTGWSKGTDGYYYFGTAVDAGEATDTPLFTSYTAGTAPETGAILKMTIIAQIKEDEWD